MKILVYGANGWIGSQFIELLSDVKYACGEARTDNENEVANEILEYRPTHVISFIGSTIEQEGKLTENIRDNLFAPLVLATICKKYNIHYTYLGTGCIFKYDEEDPTYEFEERSLPNFFGSSYSVVKGFTDRLMHLYDDDALNIRIRMPITGDENPRNFITKITTYEKICSVSNSMTVLPELLPLVFDMMMHNITGTMNLTNPGTISHNEILDMYRELVDPSFEWQNFTEVSILDSDRSNNCLDTRLLESLYPDILGIKDAVRKCLMTYKTTE